MLFTCSSQVIWCQFVIDMEILHQQNQVFINSDLTLIFILIYELNSQYHQAFY